MSRPIVYAAASQADKAYETTLAASSGSAQSQDVADDFSKDSSGAI